MSRPDDTIRVICGELAHTHPVTVAVLVRKLYEQDEHPEVSPDGKVKVWHRHKVDGWTVDDGRATGGRRIPGIGHVRTGEVSASRREVAHVTDAGTVILPCVCGLRAKLSAVRCNALCEGLSAHGVSSVRLAAIVRRLTKD
ncbi:MAG: hypothetical protein ACR2KG_08700 [Nocardioidaceae bacterium]